MSREDSFIQTLQTCGRILWCRFLVDLPLVRGRLFDPPKAGTRGARSIGRRKSADACDLTGKKNMHTSTGYERTGNRTLLVARRSRELPRSMDRGTMAKVHAHLAAYDAELEGTIACVVAKHANTTAAAAVRAWRALAVEHEKVRLTTHFQLHGQFMPEDNATAVRHWGTNTKSSTTAWHTLFEPSFSCPSIERVPRPSTAGADVDQTTWKFLCAPHRLRKPCSLLSLGCNFQDAFEEALQCRSVIVDPTLDESRVSPSIAQDFAKRVARRGDVLNRSVGIGVGVLQVGREVLPLVSLRTFLGSLQRVPNAFFPRPRAREMGAHCTKQPVNKHGAHIDVLKVDIEGSEYDLLPEVFTLCHQGLLTVDQLLVEVHSGLAWGRYKHSAASLHAVFYGAHHCQLMLFHKDLNTERAGRNSEFSWVSMRYMLRHH